MGKYRTIVADPPWPIEWQASIATATDRARGRQFVRALSYNTMTLEQIGELPVSELAHDDAHLYLWTTRRFLEATFGIVRRWGFEPGALLTWCKEPMGLGLGGAFTSNVEFILTGKRGHLGNTARVDSSWWKWTRTQHSVKPDAFLDIVEQVSPGPYVELFARRARFGWDYWGAESLQTVEMPGETA